MSNQKDNSNDDSIAQVGEKMTISDNKGNVKEELEVVNVRSGDEIQPGTRIIEYREVKK